MIFLLFVSFHWLLSVAVNEVVQFGFRTHTLPSSASGNNFTVTLWFNHTIYQNEFKSPSRSNTWYRAYKNTSNTRFTIIGSSHCNPESKIMFEQISGDDSLKFNIIQFYTESGDFYAINKTFMCIDALGRTCAPPKQIFYFDISRPNTYIEDAVEMDATSVTPQIETCAPTASLDPTSEPTLEPTADTMKEPTLEPTTNPFNYNNRSESEFVYGLNITISFVYRLVTEQNISIEALSHIIEPLIVQIIINKANARTCIDTDGINIITTALSISKVRVTAIIRSCDESSIDYLIAYTDNTLIGDLVDTISNHTILRVKAEDVIITVDIIGVIDIEENKKKEISVFVTISVCFGAVLIVVITIIVLRKVLCRKKKEDHNDHEAIPKNRKRIKSVSNDDNNSGGDKCESVRMWLASAVGIEEYYDNFIMNGYISLELIISKISNINQLADIDIDLKEHQTCIMAEIEKLKDAQNEANEDAPKAIKEGAANAHMTNDEDSDHKNDDLWDDVNVHEEGVLKNTNVTTTDCNNQQGYNELYEDDDESEKDEELYNNSADNGVTTVNTAGDDTNGCTSGELTTSGKESQVND